MVTTYLFKVIWVFSYGGKYVQIEYEYNNTEENIMTITKRTCVFILLSTASYVAAFNTPVTSASYVGYTQVAPQYLNLQLVNPQVFNNKCYNKMNNKWSLCPSANPKNAVNIIPIEDFVFGTRSRPLNNNVFNPLTTAPSNIQNGLTRRFFPQITSLLNILPIPLNKSLRTSQPSKISSNENVIRSSDLNSAFDKEYPYYYPDSRYRHALLPEVNQTKVYNVKSPTLNEKVTSPENMYYNFIRGLDELERKFYSITLDKLTQISPINRKENGISFVQSGLFLMLGLITLLSEVDFDTRKEIENCINIHLTESANFSAVTENILASLPSSSNDLKFRWSTRLILWPNRSVSDEFKIGPAAALRMHIDIFNGTETPEKIAEILNNMVEIDSGGSIRSTFEEDDLAGDAHTIFLTTMYLRGRWRSAPTVLNGSRPFRDTEKSSTRSIRCIRINDVMRYADLTEWDAEAIEIFYATPGLSLLMLVPRGNSLRRLADYVAATSIHYVTQRMHSIRVAVTMPLYTLRMTLLLPNKLESMGLSRLVDTNNTTPNSLTLSHAVQRLMFWAEAGRNAFKDDGIEWDKTPELELVVDRPYVFFVRWQNLTLMNGNFVL